MTTNPILIEENQAVKEAVEFTSGSFTKLSYIKDATNDTTIIIIQCLTLIRFSVDSPTP